MEERNNNIKLTFIMYYEKWLVLSWELDGCRRDAAGCGICSYGEQNVNVSMKKFTLNAILAAAYAYLLGSPFSSRSSLQ